MHPHFASGFLYNLKSGKILLLQTSQNESDSIWSMFGGESIEEEEPSTTFQRIIQERLDLNLKPKNIYPIYDYFHETYAKVNFVFYAEIAKTPKFDHLENSPSWVTFQQTLKLPFSSQTKQDVIVGQRVVNAKQRDIDALNGEPSVIIRSPSGFPIKFS